MVDNLFYFFSVRKRVVFYKSIHLIGSGSGWYSMRNVSSITSLAFLQFFINYKYSYLVNLASTIFDMDSDECYHCQSEFYYPEEMENYSEKKDSSGPSTSIQATSGRF